MPGLQYILESSGPRGLSDIFHGGAGHGIHAQQAAAAMAEAMGLFVGDDESEEWGVMMGIPGIEGNLDFEANMVTPMQVRHGPPPASQSTLDDLAEITVSKVDLETDGNDTCCICMEDHELGQKASKLPCGHIFHKDCIGGWLERHCTCPICRFEMPTEDAEFEVERRTRMADRKRRYRKRELESKSIKELKSIMSEIGVTAPAGALEESELMAVLVKSEHVQVLPDEPPRDMTRERLMGMSVPQLKKLMAELGVQVKGCLKKRDMISRLLESGRVKIVSSGPKVLKSYSHDARGGASKTTPCTTPMLEDRKVTPEEKARASKGGDVSVVLEAGRRGRSKAPGSSPSMDAGCAVVEGGATASRPASPGRCPLADDDLEDIIGGGAKPSGVPRAVSPSPAQVRMRSEELRKKSVRDLRGIMRSLGLPVEGCVEKCDMVRRIMSHPGAVTAGVARSSERYHPYAR